MKRLIVAFEKDESRRRICDMLEGGGIPVYAACKSGAEVIRSAKKLGGGIVVSGYKFSDMTITDLAYSLDSSVLMLLIASPIQLDCCETEDIFRLPSPVSKGDLLASVRILVQMDERQFRMAHHRSNNEEEIITRAKELLMNRNRMTEAQAHKFMQKKSMDTGSKMVDTARLIIDSY